MMMNRSLFLLLLIFVCSLAFIFGQETYSEEELQALTVEELEAICLVRGFELLKDEIDPETGEPYKLSHADYVEAAKQCLAIEEEMNLLLEQNPELKDELEEELAKMQEEQAARKAELEELQRQLNKDEKEKPSEGKAFFPKEKVTGGGGDSDSSVESKEEEEPIVSSQSQEQEIVQDASEEETDASTEESVESSTEDSTATSDGAIAKPDANKSQEDLTLAEIRRAFIQYVKKDFQRIRQFMLPVFEPMLRAGNLALKYARALVISIQQQYSGDEDAKGGEEEAGADEEVLEI